MKKIFFGSDIGIDLGTATVLVYVKGYGIVLKEPSVVAIDKNTHTVLAVGEEARRMLGKTPGNIVAIRPLRDGVISDYDVTEKMLKYFIEKSIGRHFFLRPKIAVCVPSKVTGVEKRAVEDATREAGAREVYIIEEPIAAAIGAGVDISKASGNMVVDIGGGTCDVAVISLGGTVVSDSIKMAGDKFDDAIVRYMRMEHQLLIGERTAEQIKMTIGTAFPREEEVCMDVKGRDLLAGLPKTITVSSEETLEALRECTSMIIDTIKDVLENTPPELSADISDKGIMLTGGGAMLYGLDKLITKETGIKAYYGSDDPVSCVAVGTGKYIEFQTEKVRKKRWRLW
ncbi:MAG: rod shape-determining protein MreB [Clostridiales bacterium]|nr:rod shape-determining protein MreB [Clostridiales bacterium]